MYTIRNRPETIFDFRNLVFLCLAATVVIGFLDQALIWNRWGLNEYVTREWAINYSTGFVRRGLGGTILLWLHTSLGFNVRVLLAIGGYVTYFLVAGYYCYQLFRLRIDLPRHVLATCLFLPAAVVMPLLDPAEMGRKEFLFLIILIAHITILNRYTDQVLVLDNRDGETRRSLLKKYLFRVFVVYNVLGIPTALMHEAIVSISVPINLALTFLIVYQAQNRIRSAAVTAITVYAPTILVVFFVAIYTLSHPVDLKRALEICMPFDFLEVIDCRNGLPDAIRVLTLTVADVNRQFVNYILSSVTVATGWMILIVLNLVLAVYAGLHIAGVRLRQLAFRTEERSRILDRKVLFRTLVVPAMLFPFIFVLPLTTVGHDLGRWTFVLVMSFLICAAASRHTLLFTGVGRAGGGDLSGSAINGSVDASAVHRGRSNIVYSTMLLVSLYVTSSTTLPHCCIRHEHVFDRYLSTGVVRHMVHWVHNLGLYVTERLASTESDLEDHR